MQQSSIPAMLETEARPPKHVAGVKKGFDISLPNVHAYCENAVGRTLIAQETDSIAPIHNIDNRKGGDSTDSESTVAKKRPPAPPTHTHGKTSWSSFTLPQQSRYTGYIKRFSNPPIPHGFGTLTFFDGRRYIGNFYEGLRSGKGEELRSDGKAVYSGGFFAGNRHGRGTLHFANGTIVKGVWERGKMSRTITRGCPVPYDT